MKTTNTATANAALVGEPDSSATEGDPAQQREGRVGDEVVEQVRPARAAARIASAAARGEADAHGRRRAEQRHGQDDARGTSRRSGSAWRRSTMKSLPSTSTNSSPTRRAAATAPRSRAARRLRHDGEQEDSADDHEPAAARSQRRQRGGASRRRLGAGARSAPPAARISASDQATIRSHRTTASQTITDRKVVPRSPGRHRYITIGLNGNTGLALECGAFHSADVQLRPRGGTKLRWGLTAGLLNPHIRSGTGCAAHARRSIQSGRTATRKERVMGWRN